MGGWSELPVGVRFVQDGLVRIGFDPRRPSTLYDREEISVNVAFVASVAVIAADPAESRKLYVDALGLPLEPDKGGDYFHSEKIGGVKHFGVWPLAEAAQACFGTDEWPEDRTIPQASIEFEVTDEASVAPAAKELEQLGFSLLHEARTEPWGQTVARLLSIEGSVIGISYAPWLHG
jgi:catechol 2,3-dioxygenase-like lactoylglutathione lyase family enzyme